jgi:predicted 2-oxoglutarate/Fe(II)-dependent dioxygenase YbiX
MIEYFTIKNFLSEHQCNEIIKFSLENLKLRDGLVGSEIYDERIRKSSISFTNYDTVFPYIKENLLKEIVEKIKIKGYEINFENQPYQFTRYNKGEFYNWHTDSANNGYSADRYCSIVIQLNNDYEGGDLEMMKDETKIQFEKGTGNLFVFLSSITHRVNEIVDGTRYSLVSWFTLKPTKDFKKTLI